MTNIKSKGASALILSMINYITLMIFTSHDNRMDANLASKGSG